MRARVVIISPGCFTLLPVMREISRATSDFALQVLPNIPMTLVAMVVRSRVDHSFRHQRARRSLVVSRRTVDAGGYCTP